MPMLAPLAKPFAAFFRWWFGELRSLLPSGLGSGLSNGRKELIVDWSSDAVAFAVGGDRRSKSLGAWPLNELKSEPPSTLAKALQRAKRGRLAVHLRLPPEQVLRRTLELPQAAQENLRQALGFQIPQISPFEASRALFDYRVTKRDQARKRLQLEVAVVSAVTVAALAEHLAAWGLPLDRVGVQPDGDDPAPPFDFLTAERDQAAVRNPRLVETALTVSAVALAIAVVLLPLRQLDRIATGLATELAEAKREAEAVEAIRNELAGGLDLAGTVLAARQERSPQIAALRDLTDLLGDEVWLLQYQFEGGEARISGYAPDAAALIRQLESASGIVSPRFVAPVTRESGSALERFSIAYKLAEAS